MPTTVKQLKQQAEELLKLAPMVERYNQLQTQIKAGLIELSWMELNTPAGSISISTTTELIIPLDVAQKALGRERAKQISITRTQTTVSTKITKAFVDEDQITPDEWNEIKRQSETKTITRLHIRPK